MIFRLRFDLKCFSIKNVFILKNNLMGNILWGLAGTKHYKFSFLYVYFYSIIFNSKLRNVSTIFGGVQNPIETLPDLSRVGFGGVPVGS
jgi:hypothetical protein